MSPQQHFLFVPPAYGAGNYDLSQNLCCAAHTRYDHCVPLNGCHDLFPFSKTEMALILIVLAIALRQ
jgi:hypothetical protein